MYPAGVEGLAVWFERPCNTSSGGGGWFTHNIVYINVYCTYVYTTGVYSDLFFPCVLHVEGGDDGLLLALQHLAPPLLLQPLLVLPDTFFFIYLFQETVVPLLTLHIIYSNKASFNTFPFLALHRHGWTRLSSPY
jgi:hypothetical protein